MLHSRLEVKDNLQDAQQRPEAALVGSADGSQAFIKLNPSRPAINIAALKMRKLPQRP